MKSLLLYEHQELSRAAGYPDKDAIIQDLNLKVIFQAASHPVWKAGDSSKKIEKEDFYIYDVMKRIMLTPLENKEQVLYRQKIVREAVERPELIQAMYDIGQEGANSLGLSRNRGKEKRTRTGVGSGEMIGTFEMLKKSLGCLDRLKELLNNEKFTAESGLSALKCRINEEYGDEFCKGLREVINDLEFFTEGGSVIFSTGLGVGLKEEKLRLKQIQHLVYGEKADVLKEKNGKWYQRLFPSNIIQLREEEEFREAKRLEEVAFSYVLSWMEPLLKDLCDFFEAFQVQSAFYLGCVHLWERAQSFGAGFCFPKVSDRGQGKSFDFHGLYELSMAILTRSIPVSNSIEQRDCWLMVVTGANQGGKSTYLRSFGIAQVMLQCGMFVPAAGYSGSLYRNIYTHFTRREDVAMNSGRLDEELKRMDGILRTVTEDSLLLLNESFATTTEKEGSVIAMDLVSALYESGITVAMVTHLLQFARELYAKQLKHVLFLSAERKEDGTRTFHIMRRAPENTSFGLDLFEEIIGE